MITEWDLVCEDKWMKTFAKLLLFSGITFKKVQLTLNQFWGKYQSKSRQRNGKHKMDKHTFSLLLRHSLIKLFFTL